MKKSIFFVLIFMIASNYLNAQDMKLKITIGDREFTATLYDNDAARELTRLLPMTVTMSEMGGYEKYYYLPRNLSGTATRPGTIEEGDLMLWSSNCLVLFYATHPTSYSYVRLGKIDDTAGLREAVGNRNVEVSFEIEEAPADIENAETDKTPFRVSYLPESNFIEVSGNFDMLTLFDMKGRSVARSLNRTLYTGDIPAGTYLLRIDSEKEKSMTMKINKK